MKTYLVTGAAGFIGANFIKYLLNKKYQNQDIKVLILDDLTYAGNLGTIKEDIDNKRCFLSKEILLIKNSFKRYLMSTILIISSTLQQKVM